MKRILFTITGGVLLLFTTALARPYPDQLGICYAFTNGNITQTAACVIGTGYGAGAQYMNLIFGNRNHYIEFPNIRPNMAPTLDGKTALTYKRNAAFHDILKGAPIDGEEYMECIKTKDGKVDVCYYKPGAGQ